MVNLVVPPPTLVRFRTASGDPIWTANHAPDQIIPGFAKCGDIDLSGGLADTFRFGPEFMR